MRPSLGFEQFGKLRPPRGPEAAVPESQITDLNARELSAAIHGRRVSCVEVMTAYLDQIADVNPRHNAIVALRERDVLLAEAATKDAALAADCSQGWMHGFPHAGSAVGACWPRVAFRARCLSGNARANVLESRVRRALRRIRLRRLARRAGFSLRQDGALADSRRGS